MTPKEHRYEILIRWTGNTGTGTSSYRGYERRHEITAPAQSKPAIPGSSDPSFNGDPTRWNPEELLVASLSACHQLWYLHLCADAGLVVTSYVDRAEGVMVQDDDGGGRFRLVVLHPVVSFAPGANLERAQALHAEAHRLCFIANSVNFQVAHEPKAILDP